MSREETGSAGIAGAGRVVLIGYRSYPGKTDFDVQRGDRFSYSSTVYQVTYIDDTIPGRREAVAESSQ
jgi:hypothetical protein